MTLYVKLHGDIKTKILVYLFYKKEIEEGNPSFYLLFI